MTGDQPWLRTSLVNAFFAAIYPQIGVAKIQIVITTGDIHGAISEKRINIYLICKIFYNVKSFKFYCFPNFSKMNFLKMIT